MHGQKKLTGLAAESRNAADYLGNLPREKWVAYAMAEVYGVFAHGVKTNQQVESQNGSISEARCHAPLQCIHLIVNIISQFPRLLVSRENGPRNTADHNIVSHRANRTGSICDPLF